MTKNEKLIYTDAFYRALLWESLSHTSMQHNLPLLDFIINEASLSQVISTVHGIDRFPLNEQNMVNSNEFNNEQKVRSFEPFIDIALGMGLWNLASGVVDKQLLQRASRVGLIKKVLNLKGVRGSAKFMGGMLLTSAATTILVKVLKVMAMKFSRNCAKTCKSRGTDNNGDPNAYKRCFQQCRVNSLQKIVTKLRADISKCKTTDNPEKCQSTMVKQVAKYNDMLAEAREKLQQLSRR